MRHFFLEKMDGVEVVEMEVVVVEVVVGDAWLPCTVIEET